MTAESIREDAVAVGGTGDLNAGEDEGDTERPGDEELDREPNLICDRRGSCSRPI